jgi:hypothetical protein
MVFTLWIWGSARDILNQPVVNSKIEAKTPANVTSPKAAGETKTPNASAFRVISNETKTTSDGLTTSTTLREENATHIRTTTQSVSSSVIRERALVFVSIIFGTLGASVHGITSLAMWYSNRKLKRSFLFWYLSRPLIGAALALVVYLLLRATLLSSSVVEINRNAFINAFGVAGISALVGLMTPQITKKLRDVFDQLFGIGKAEEERGDEPGTGATIKLSAEKNQIEVGKDSLLIAVLTDSDGNPAEGIETYFAIFDSNRASFIEEQIPPKKTDRKGVAVIRFQAKKEGQKIKAISTAKVGKDIELYDQIDFEITSTAPSSDTTPPTIASKDPDKDAPNVDTTKAIKIVFSENMLKDTINVNTIKLFDEKGTQVVEGTKVSLDESDKKTVNIIHNPLEKGKRYTVNITTGVKDLAGNAITSEVKWSFSTQTT